MQVVEDTVVGGAKEAANTVVDLSNAVNKPIDAVLSNFTRCQFGPGAPPFAFFAKSGSRYPQLSEQTAETPTSFVSASQCLGCGRRRPARIRAAYGFETCIASDISLTLIVLSRG